MAPPYKYQNIDLYDKSVLQRYFVVLSAVTDLFFTRNITTFPRTLASKLTGQPEEPNMPFPSKARKDYVRPRFGEHGHDY